MLYKDQLGQSSCGFSQWDGRRGMSPNFA